MSVIFSETIGEDKTMEIPFTVLKKDVPIELARYIQNFVMEESHQDGFYNKWAKKTIKAHTWTVRRLYRAYGVDQTIRVGHVHRAKIMDRQTNDQIAADIIAARSKSTNAKAKRKGSQ